MFKLPEIDFFKAKFLSDETVFYHHGKHHRAYIDNLNKFTKDLPPKDIIDIIKTSDGALFNNAAQSWNHTFYWLGLTPSQVRLKGDSALSKRINIQYGSEEKLKEKFLESAIGLFGSGWTWLVLNVQSKQLEIVNTGNASVIDLEKYKPLLICDVWEHAYYIQYRNLRLNYLSDFWNAINWNFVGENFEKDNLKKVGDLMKG